MESRLAKLRDLAKISKIVLNPSFKGYLPALLGISTLLASVCAIEQNTKVKADSQDTIAFEKILVAPGARGKPFTTVAVADNMLFAGTLEGEILRFSLNPDGTTADQELITTLQSTHGGRRLITGIIVDPKSTSQNPILWVPHSDPSLSVAADWSGMLSQLSGHHLEISKDYIIGFPRSNADHATNGGAFGPNGRLYIAQGSQTAVGATDDRFNHPEHILSAAILEIDLNTITTFPFNIKTEEGSSYNPFATNAPVKIYASGLRNAYDLTWHTNGQLYAPNNGSSPGGNTPQTPSVLPVSCLNRIDYAQFGPYFSPAVIGFSNLRYSQPDHLYRIANGGYYGHPNPARCEWVLNGGNPTSATDYLEVPQYPVGTLPDRNFKGIAYDFGQHVSPNGIIEYKSSTFGGALKGKLLVVRFNMGSDIIALTPGGPSLDITGATINIPGFTDFAGPLDLAENPRTGDIYLAEFTGKRIWLLRPLVARPTPTTPPPKDILISSVFLNW